MGGGRSRLRRCTGPRRARGASRLDAFEPGVGGGGRRGRVPPPRPWTGAGPAPAFRQHQGHGDRSRPAALASARRRQRGAEPGRLAGRRTQRRRRREPAADRRRASNGAPTSAHRVRALVRLGGRRVRPPHRHRDRVRAAGLGGDGARHLPLPPQLERLERHWLQLPGRSLRHHLRRTGRRYRSGRGRRPGAGLQRPLDRGRKPRHVQHRRADRRRPRRDGQAALVEAVRTRSSATGTVGVDPAGAP